MQFWNELEGQVLDGLPLRRLARAEGRTAWFETESPEGGAHPATISLTESLTDTDEVTERLQAAQRIQHPDLIVIGKVGQARLDGTFFVYAIMEHADQNLSDILRERALSPTEARQVAETMVGALSEIHRRGLLHGRVEPASVLAVGDSVKLRTDCLQSPGATRAGDIAGIGATLFEALSQRKASLATDAQIKSFPAPFAEIIRNSLSSRWSLAQIAAALKLAPVPVHGVATSTGAEGKPLAPSTKPPQARVEPIRPITPEEEDEEQDRAESHFRPVLLLIGLAIVVLLFGWLLFRPKAHPRTDAARTSAASGSVHVASRPPAAAAIPPPAPAPAKPAPAPAKPSTVRQEGAAGSGTRSIWRVVAYTYRRQDQAQRKVDEVNNAHSALRASVFSPKGNSGIYLVVLGGAMDRADAFEMRDKARSMGLPSDTYAQNFSR